MLMTLWKYRNLIALAAAGFLVAFLFLRISALNNEVQAKTVEITDLTDQRDRAAAIANSNADALARARKERDRTVALLDEANAERNARNEIVNNIIRGVENAEPAKCSAGARLVAAHGGLLELTRKAAGN